MNKALYLTVLLAMPGLANADISTPLFYGSKSVYDDGGKYTHWKSSGAASYWIFDHIGSGYYNIRSSTRPSACIYDSSGSIRAKMDSSCNTNAPRAEWKPIPIIGTPYGTIVNKLGRCLEMDYVSGYKKDLKAIDCNGSQNQLFNLMWF
jgi:hypothetical protein